MCLFCVEFGLICLRTENNCTMTRTLLKFKLFCKYLMQNLIYNKVSPQMPDLTSPQSMWLKHFEINFWEEKKPTKCQIPQNLNPICILATCEKVHLSSSFSFHICMSQIITFTESIFNV